MSINNEAIAQSLPGEAATALEAVKVAAERLIAACAGTACVLVVVDPFPGIGAALRASFVLHGDNPRIDALLGQLDAIPF